MRTLLLLLACSQVPSAKHPVSSGPSCTDAAPVA